MTKTLPKLLLISAIPPFPKQSGGAVRIYHTIKELSRKYQIYFVTFDSDNNQFYQKYTKLFVNLNKKPKSLSSAIPYRFTDWDNQEIKLIINKIIKDYDIKQVQIEFTQLLYLADTLKHYDSKVLTIFTAHDISTVSFWRRIPESQGIFKKMASFFFWLQIYFYEKKYLPKFGRVITVSPADQKYLKNLFGLNSTIIPNGIEKIQFLTKKPHHTINLGYIGSFSHPPNKFAVNYFINHIAPLLEKNKIKYRFYLAGNNPGFTHPKVTNLGLVPDVIDFYQQIDYLIAPIFSGSGTRIKILESLSFGIPVITTQVGAEGLFVSDFIMLAQKPIDFVSQLKKPKNFSLDQLKIKLQPYLWSNALSNN